jgi:nicotinate-nucleotide adenylyltransferase
LKTGLFFGSFNPIHIGHLILAGYMSEFTDLSEVWFVVSPQNPLKEKKTLLGDHHRLELVRKAAEGFQKLKVSDIEFKLPKPSYTIDTLTYLREKYPKKKFALILGADNLQGFKKWKNYEEILNNYELYVYPRPHQNDSELKEHPSVHFVDAPMVEISATFIRKAIKEKKDVSFMLPKAVAEYIEEMNFYKNPSSFRG